MSESPSSPLSSNPGGGLTLTQRLICIIASIGFAFDTYELLMLPLVIKPAITTLSHAAPGDPNWLPTGPHFRNWARVLFFLPAIPGGIFGLLGGYLTDRLGRRRVLTWSILLYAFGACASGYATSLYQLLFFRCLVFIGVCVEFVAAVAWLAELFPERVQRERILGYTQAFSSLGGVMVALMNKGAANFAGDLPAIHGLHEAWRYTLISGVIPALPLILIRPFLPESPQWLRKRQEGTLRRPSLLELFAPQLRWTTILTTLVFASTFGLAYGAIQQHSQIISAHVATKAAIDKAVAQRQAQPGPAPTTRELAPIRANTTDDINATTQTYQEIGGLVGRIVLAIVIVYIASKRLVLRMFQIPGMIFVPLLFWWIGHHLNDPDSLGLFRWGMFIAGFLVVAQMSFWGNYIPLVFPLHLRGTGESFAANIGGRVIGTAAAFLALTLSQSGKDTPALFTLATASAVVALVYAVVGAILTQWLPEPKEQDVHST
jgi:MFS family permease